MKGVKQGFGQFWWTTGKHKGDKYIGQFNQDQRHGYGQYIFENDNAYDGNWVEGRQHGQGMIRCVRSQLNETLFNYFLLLFQRIFNLFHKQNDSSSPDNILAWKQSLENNCHFDFSQ